jgi:GNAT superfamily N-acetyltransferase
MNIDELVCNIKERYSGTEIYLFENKKYIFIDIFIVSQNKRCMGVGSHIMNMIINYAKEVNKPISLLPSEDYGASSIERLKTFYKRFGFIENKILRDKRFKIKYLVKLV